MSYKHFSTGVFSVNDLSEMRERAGKPEVLLDIGQQLRSVRKGRQIDRKLLASRCDLSADQLGRFEHGLFEIGFSVLQKLCAELDVDLVALLSPYMLMSADAARSMIELARSWEAGGQSLSVIDVIMMSDPGLD